MKCQVALHMGSKFAGHSSAMHGPFGTSQELWRMAHGAKVGAQQRSSACEDNEKSSPPMPGSIGIGLQFLRNSSKAPQPAIS